MAPKRGAKAKTVKVAGKKPASIGAKKVGDKIVIRQEVTSRKGTTPVVRFVTTRLPSRAQSKSKAKASEWMGDPRLPGQLLTAFSKAVSRAKSGSTE